MEDEAEAADAEARRGGARGYGRGGAREGEALQRVQQCTRRQAHRGAWRRGAAAGEEARAGCLGGTKPIGLVPRLPWKFGSWKTGTDRFFSLAGTEPIRFWLVPFGSRFQPREPNWSRRMPDGQSWSDTRAGRPDTGAGDLEPGGASGQRPVHTGCTEKGRRTGPRCGHRTPGSGRGRPAGTRLGCRDAGARGPSGEPVSWVPLSVCLSLGLGLSAGTRSAAWHRGWAAERGGHGPGGWRLEAWSVGRQGQGQEGGDGFHSSTAIEEVGRVDLCRKY
jgi:hypothetical protein